MAVGSGAVSLKNAYETMFASTHTTGVISNRSVAGKRGNVTPDGFGEYKNLNNFKSGLVSYWDFNDSLTTYGLNDEYGTNDGTTYQTTTYNASGKNGGCWDFSGTGSRVVIPDSATLNPANWTISFWMNPDLQNAQYERIWAWPGYDFEIAIGISYDIKIYDGGWRSTGLSVSSSSWSHVVVTMSSTSGSRTRVNNGTPFARSTVRTLSGNMYIGSSSSGSENYNGKLDEMGFWNRVLSSSDITELYNGGTGKFLSSFDGPY